MGCVGFRRSISSLTHTHTHTQSNWLPAVGVDCSWRADVKPVKRVDSCEAHRAARVFFTQGTQKATSKRRSFLIHSTPSECDKSTLTQSLWGGTHTHTHTHKEKTFPCEASDFLGAKTQIFNSKLKTAKRTQTKSMPARECGRH